MDTNFTTGHRVDKKIVGPPPSLRSPPPHPLPGQLQIIHVIWFLLSASFIVHSSGKCVSVEKPEENNPDRLGYLVLTKDCNDTFSVPDETSIRHNQSGNCVKSRLDRGETRLVLQNCSSAGKYELMNNYLIKDLDYSQCWSPKGLDIRNPDDGVRVFLTKDCVYDKGLEFKFQNSKYKRFVFFSKM